jgi:hypothetical protein
MTRSFWEQTWNLEPSPVVGPSVLTDLCNAAPSQGNITMQKILGLLVAAPVFAMVLVAASSTARADTKKGGDKAGDAAKVKVYDFSGDTIEGDLIKPEGTTVDARDFAKHGSLIRIRKDFIPEIVKSAEDLQ